MHGSEEDHLPRIRPLSGGIWTFFSWLRRPERSSSESVSSVGSDRSVASFDFLGPTEYITKPPLTISTNDPTDTYNKRLYDREIRRQRDHDMTIHRKYGLLRFEGYDSLPVKRSNIHFREQRATSECYQRRTPYVPGKRRAPLPPTTVTAVTLPRYKRKRPAPQPPNVIPRNHENNTEQGKIMQTNDNTKFVSDLKSRTTRDKEKVLRHSKSFLRQIFDNRKSLNIDTSHVKFLPSISELDKQALEIIERKKAFKSTMGDNFHLAKRSENPWICTICLRKYQSSVVFCLHCQSKEVSKKDNNSSMTRSKVNSNISTQGKLAKTNDINEKEELKRMLKEMKNSLPKRSVRKQKSNEILYVPESSTLRIGDNINNDQHPTSSKVFANINFKTKDMSTISEVSESASKHSNIILHRVSLQGVPNRNVNDKSIEKNDLVQCASTNVTSDPHVTHETVGSSMYNLNVEIKSNNLATSKKNDRTKKNVRKIGVNTSNKTNEINNIDVAVSDHFKESSLLGSLIAEKNQENNTKNVELPADDITRSSNKQLTKSSLRSLPSPSSNLSSTDDHISKPTNYHGQNNHKKVISNNSTNMKFPINDNGNVKPVNKNLEMLSHHSRRRNLVSQLEQSISKGDAKTAAEAAAELAKLRLSCSVLSFSSQIVADNPAVSLNKSSIQIISTNTVKSDTTQPQPKLTPQNITNVNQDIKVISELKEPKKVSYSCVTPVQPGTSKLMNTEQADELLTIKVWIEDKETARGPVNVKIGRYALMEDLMQHADAHLGLPIQLQRWIVGKNLCTDYKTPLLALAGTDFSAPFYLCLVQPESKQIAKHTTNCKQDQTETQPQASSKVTCSSVYKDLINLEKEAIVPNTEPFECEVCMEPCGQGDGIVLRECIHIFCKNCVTDAVKHCQEPVVACPAFNCSGTLQDREIRALLNYDEYERWLARGLVTAESGTRNTFHCRTTDCKGWAFCEQGVRRFPCPVCKHTNCIPCQAIHENDTCEEYKERLTKAVTLAEKNEIDDGTRSFLDSLIQRGEALACPECNTIITKKWGCDWIKCFACKTEICWVTKGRRWGPAGKGDISGGCRCGIDGKRCHPTCSYCH